MFRKFATAPGLIFTLVVVWKILLLLTTAQPIPFSDAFFYDGPVVNLLNGGIYANPSLELVLPISATQVFSAYPPLYQFLLWLWMSVFGASVLAAMWLHLVLFIVFGLALLTIFRHLQVPALAVNIGCLFLFGITYHDRPDSLAFALGAWAIYAWLRVSGKSTPWFALTKWHGLAVGLNVLTLATSLQLGMMFLGWSALLVLLICWSRRQSFPWLAFALTAVIPLLLVLYVKQLHPALWAGFQEHVRETPSLLGTKMENLTARRLAQFLKLGRYTPAVFFAVACLGLLFLRDRVARWERLKSVATIFLLTALAVAAGIVTVSTVLLMFVVHWLTYVQVPIVVGVLYLLHQQNQLRPRLKNLMVWSFVALSVVAGTRSLGLSIWGLANARDVSHATALQRVQAELKKCPPQSTVVASAAYLYEASKFRQLRLLHSDWLSTYRESADRLPPLIRLKPPTVILTQFDWYRWYEPVFTQLQQQTNLVSVTINNDLRVRAPDSYPKFQKVLQHTSWAPVILKLDWKTNAAAPVPP